MNDRIRPRASAGPLVEPPRLPSVARAFAAASHGGTPGRLLLPHRQDELGDEDEDDEVAEGDAKRQRR